MSAAAIGEAIYAARKAQGVSRVELAQRVGVSVRLVGELERGARPNVSLDTALRLLAALGVSFRFGSLAATDMQTGHAPNDSNARAARAAQRRATWTGARWPLQDDHVAPAAGEAEARLGSVAEVSRLAYAIAAAPRAAVSSSPRATQRLKK